MRHGAIAAQVEVPLEGLGRQLVLLDPSQEQIVVRDALAAADDLAVALRRQHVHAQGDVGPLRVGLHVEGLHLRRVPGDRHGPVETVREQRLVGRAEIAAPLEGLALLVEHLHRVVVRDAREGLLHQFELRDVPVEPAQFGPAALEHARHHRDHQVLGQLDDIVELREGDLRLDHPELGEMAARLRLLGPERRAEAVDAAEGHGVGLVVELAALREVRRGVVEVLDREERRRALAGRRREYRRVGQDEATIVEERPHGGDDLGAHPEDGALALAANPEVPAIHEEIDAVLLRRDGVVRRRADDLERRQVEFEAPGRPRVGTDRPRHDDRRFLRQVIGLPERLLVDGGLRHDALDEAAAVADGQEVDPAARPPGVQPSPDDHALAFVPGDVFDVGEGPLVCHVQLRAATSRRAIAWRARSSAGAAGSAPASSSISVPS